MKVVKFSGDIVEFNSDKLRKSLLKSGADNTTVDWVMDQIQHQIYNGIATKMIYKMAFQLLKKSAHSHAARYNLRTALQQLGPAGFFFEKYIARLYHSEGYTTQTNRFLQGKCVTHEIDIVIAQKGIVEMIECKFHSGNDAVSDVKVPMYILSRFNDVKGNEHSLFRDNDLISHCRIVTNNRFTSDAITFAQCSGLQLLSWDFPEHQSLRDIIDNNQLYPVTCLTTLTAAEKEKLLIQDVILAAEIPSNLELLQTISLSSNRIKKVLKEVSELCNYSRL